MKKRPLTVKALVFVLVLMFVSGSLSFTYAAASALPAAPSSMTHVGQPVENLISLEYSSAGYNFFRVGPTILDTNPNENFVVPEGCKLVITDIYYIQSLSNNPYNGPVWLYATKKDSGSQIIFYQYPHLLDYGNGQKVTEISEHFTTGIVVEPGFNLSSIQRKDIAFLMLRGYLTGSVPVSNGQGQPAAPIVTPNPAPTGIGPLISTNPAHNSPSVVTKADPWAGSWMTSNQGLGMMELSLTGNSATGTLGGGMYLLAGTVSGKTFTAEWMEPETSFGGKLELTLSEDGKSFAGRWSSSNSLGWQPLTGKRQ